MTTPAQLKDNIAKQLRDKPIATISEEALQDAFGTASKSDDDAIEEICEELQVQRVENNTDFDTGRYSFKKL